jgi:hypothetical protein
VAAGVVVAGTVAVGAETALAVPWGITVLEAAEVEGKAPAPSVILSKTVPLYEEYVIRTKHITNRTIMGIHFLVKNFDKPAWNAFNMIYVYSRWTKNL